MLNKANYLKIIDLNVVLIIPGRPVPGGEYLGNVFLEGRQVVEGIHIPCVSGADQAQEHVADQRAKL